MVPSQLFLNKVQLIELLILIMAIREELESAYKKFRAGIDEPTAATALNMLDHTGLPESAGAMFSSMWESPEKKIWLKTELYPDLSTVKFVGIREQGDWAGYYFLTTITIGVNGEESKQISLTVMRFHKVEGNWKIYQQVSSAGPHEEDDWSNVADSLDAIVQTRDNLAVFPDANFS